MMTSSNNNTYGIVQAVLAGGTALLTLFAGLILTVVGIIQIIINASSISGEYPLYSFGLVLLTIGALLVPFIVIKIKSLSYTTTEIAGKSFEFRLQARFLLPGILVLWAGVILAGYFLIDRGVFSTLVMPLLAILGVILPIFTYLYIARKMEKPLESSRSWGAISAGMILSPLMGTILEFGIMAIALAFIILIIMQDASIISNLEIMATRLSSGQNNPEIINNILSSFIRQPVNKFFIYALIAGLIPVIEEVVKQLPLWLLSSRKLTPRMGFFIGAIGGAGFALTESLMTISTMGGSDQWLYLIIGRAGAGLMHVITGAIGGWGLASAIQGRSYTRAILAYLFSVLIHGVWNALATWEGIARLVGSPSLTTFSISGESLMPIFFLGILFLGMLTLLVTNNKLLKD